MEQIWHIISGWEPIGQGIFLVLVLMAIFSLAEKVLHYVAVWLQGWTSGQVSIVAASLK